MPHTSLPRRFFNADAGFVEQAIRSILLAITVDQFPLQRPIFPEKLPNPVELEIFPAALAFEGSICVVIPPNPLGLAVHQTTFTARCAIIECKGGPFAPWKVGLGLRRNPHTTQQEKRYSVKNFHCVYRVVETVQNSGGKNLLSWVFHKLFMVFDISLRFRSFDSVKFSGVLHNSSILARMIQL